MEKEKIKVILEIVQSRLGEKYDTPVRINEISELSGGCINLALKLGTNVGYFFLKLNSDCPKDIFVGEAESLTELRKAAGNNILIPEVIEVKEVDENPGFLLTEFFRSGNSDQSEKLGRGLAFIHKYHHDNFGFHSNNYCGETHQNNGWSADWIEFYRTNRLQYILEQIQKARPVSATEMQVFDKLLSRLEIIIPNNEKASLIHGDLWSGNYMITENGPALIDPAASYSHREMEFGIITMFGGFSQRFFDAYNEVYPLDNDWQGRNLLYQLYHVLNHYYLFGGGYLQQAVRIAERYV